MTDYEYEEEPDRLPEERDLLDYREEGDPLALTRVFDALALEVLVIAAHAERDAEHAVRAVESTFVALVADVDCWDRSQPLLGWLAAVVARRAGRGDANAAPDVRAPLERALAAEEIELATRVSAAFDSMPPILRQTLVRRGLRGLAPDELALSLHVDVETVQARLRGAFEHLRAQLPEDLHAAVDLAESGQGLGAVRKVVLARIDAIAAPPADATPAGSRSEVGSSRRLGLVVGALVLVAAVVVSILLRD